MASMSNEIEASLVVVDVRRVPVTGEEGRHDLAAHYV
jgi:hypothetical protein